jgi:putative transposase
LERAHLLDVIKQVHAGSRGTYGARRVHAELRLGLQPRAGLRRVERLMHLEKLAGVHRRRFRHSGPNAPVHDDVVARRFVADAPNRLWVTDTTQLAAAKGGSTAVVLDVFSRRVMGWSIADRLRTEPVIDALDMARWRRKPLPGTVLHSDHGSQYTSWLFGTSLREAALLGSMGAVGSTYDNALMESSFGSMQIELLDRRTWDTREQLASAIFEWIEAFYNPVRRHSNLGYLSPLNYERLHTSTKQAA